MPPSTPRVHNLLVEDYVVAYVFNVVPLLLHRLFRSTAKCSRRRLVLRCSCRLQTSPTMSKCRRYCSEDKLHAIGFQRDILRPRLKVECLQLNFHPFDSLKSVCDIESQSHSIHVIPRLLPSLFINHVDLIAGTEFWPPIVFPTC